MKEAITWVHAKDVRVGDFVSGCSWPSGPKEVTEISPNGKVICGNYGRLRPLGGDVFLLHARSWPAGKTKEDMLKAVEERAHEFLMLREFIHDAFADEAMEELSEAITAYKLGKK